DVLAHAPAVAIAHSSKLAQLCKTWIPLLSPRARQALNLSCAVAVATPCNRRRQSAPVRSILVGCRTCDRLFVVSIDTPLELRDQQASTRRTPATPPAPQPGTSGPPNGSGCSSRRRS